MSNIDTTAVKDSDVISVRNLADNKVVYSLPTGVRREFPAGATLKVTAEELRSLSYERGGSDLLLNYLHVGNESLAKELGVSDDSWANEYSWTPKQIKECLTGDDLDMLKDALDFAPEGVKDAIVQMAVDLEIPDVRKREIIQEKTGNNITQKIENKHLVEASSGEEEAPKPVRRRKTASATTTRRRVTKKEDVSEE